MKHLPFIASMLLCASALLSQAQTSNVETVKAWTRTHIMGIPGGTVLDPTGTIADGQRAAAAAAIIVESSDIVAAANTGLTNALKRLDDAAANTNNFTGRLYLAAEMDDDPDCENIEAFVVREVYESNTVHYFTHYTRALATPPATVWEFNPAPGVTYWATGTVATNNATTNIFGYACYDIAVGRPAAVGNILLRTNKFLKWGTADTPLDIADAGLELVCNGVTNTPYTGSVTFTNGTLETVEIYLSGFLYTVSTNEVPQ